MTINTTEIDDNTRTRTKLRSTLPGDVLLVFDDLRNTSYAYVRLDPTTSAILHDHMKEQEKNIDEL